MPDDIKSTYSVLDICDTYLDINIDKYIEKQRHEFNNDWLVYINEYSDKDIFFE